LNYYANLSVETLRVDIQTEQEKKVLLAFLDSLNYRYQIDNGDYTLSDEEVQEIIKRKANFLAGKTTSRPWIEIKNK
jgi:hypothetical protein